nr:molybdopterin cofactor-binding domain-containing protein [uncultured Halomonas sp.]
MTQATHPRGMTRRAFLQAGGCLVVSFAIPLGLAKAAGPGGSGGKYDGVNLVPTDKVDSFIAITSDGSVIARNGKVDLGTGIRTAFSQIVAEELDVPLTSVSMVLGDPDRTPNQGRTIASASIQVSAIPMRKAAAQARQFLLQLASKQMNVPIKQLSVSDGVITAGKGKQRLNYGELVQGQSFDLEIAEDAPLKDPEKYKFVGKPVPRVDIPTKVTGGLIYVHDMRLPNMLHARVVRPPYGGRDSGDMIGSSLESVDKDSVAHIHSLVDVVTIKDFVAVLAEREEDAIDASRQLKVSWKTPPALQDLSDLKQALTDHPADKRPLKQQGDIEKALKGNDTALRATYVWSYQMHASIGPSCGLAEWKDDQLTVWTGSQNPHVLHADIAELLDLPTDKLRVVRMEAAGCYGRNCADDASAEAALLAHRLKRAVRVQLMREEEHVWEPKGTAQLMQVQGAVTGKNTLAYDFTTAYPSNGAPLLAALFTGRTSSKPETWTMADRTSVPQYRCSDLNVVARDMAPIVRASWLRGVSALPNVFAHESFMDELASAEKADPVEFRLRFMENPRAIALTKAVADRANWSSRSAPNLSDKSNDGLLRGRGFSQHQYVHGAFPGVGAAWGAWAIEIDVDPATGYIRVNRVVVGQDAGLMINPAGIRHQIHGNVVQSVSRLLHESVHFDDQGVTDREWGAYPILKFSEVPKIEVVLMPDNGNPPLGSGEAASVPSGAAMANAIFDATGVRMREAPFTPERVKAALASRKESEA